MPRRKRLRRNPDIDLNTQKGFNRAEQLARPRVATARGITAGDVVSTAYVILEITEGKSGVRSERQLKIALDQAVTLLLAERRAQQKIKARLGEATVEELRAVGAPTGRAAADEGKDTDIQAIKEAFEDIGVSPEQWTIIEEPPKTQREAAMQGHAPRDAAVMRLAAAAATFGVIEYDTEIQDALAAIDLADVDVDVDI
jgi:hypothetical protein